MLGIMFLILTYLLLAIVLLGTSTLTEIKSIWLLTYGLLIVGAVNVIYSAWVLVFGDFIGWQNPYKHILGTFGNPDFISAFLGIFITTLLALMADRTAKLSHRLTALFLALVAFYEIVNSHAIQGIVVTGGGIAIVGFFAVRAYIKQNSITFIYLIAVAVTGTLALMGALQKGPLTFIYKALIFAEVLLYVLKLHIVVLTDLTPPLFIKILLLSDTVIPAVIPDMLFTTKVSVFNENCGL
jgi:hypothetical protein